MQIFKRGRGTQWNRDKIGSLSTVEVRQLRANALRLVETEVAALCDEVLAARRARTAAKSGSA